MQYLGGKSRLAGKFAPILQESIDRTDGFLEPFGYARGEGRNYVLETKRHLLGVFPLVYDARFVAGSYEGSIPPDGRRWTIYCDPPYQKTTRYRGKSGDFDSSAFFQWCDVMASDGHHVYVSEFSAPDRWEVVWEKERVENLSGKSNKRVERLYRVPG